VCTYTQDKHNDIIVSGVLGEGAAMAAKPPAPAVHMEEIGYQIKLNYLFSRNVL